MIIILRDVNASTMGLKDKEKEERLKSIEATLYQHSRKTEADIRACKRKTAWVEGVRREDTKTTIRRFIIEYSWKGE